MKIIRKAAVAILCICLLLSLCACGNIKGKVQKANRILATVGDDSWFSQYDTPGVIEGAYGDAYCFGMMFSENISNSEYPSAAMMFGANKVCDTVNSKIIPLFRGTGLDTLILLKTSSGEIYASIFNGELSQ